MKHTNGPATLESAAYANMMSMDYVVALQQLFVSKMGIEPMLWMVQISRGNYQMDNLRMETCNPSFLLKAVKPLGVSR